MPHNHTRYKMHQSTERAKLSSASRHSASAPHAPAVFILLGWPVVLWAAKVSKHNSIVFLAHGLGARIAIGSPCVSAHLHVYPHDKSNTIEA